MNAVNNVFALFYVVNIFDIFGFFFVVGFPRRRNLFWALVEKFAVGEDDCLEILQNSAMRSYAFCKSYEFKNFTFFQNFFYAFFVVGCNDDIVIWVLVYKLCNIIEMCLEVLKWKRVKFNNFVNYIVKKNVKYYLDKSRKFLDEAFKT